jgi:hypothetical protein
MTLSRRDRLIVAKPGTKCLGIDGKLLRPGGTVEVIVSPSVRRIGSIVPQGRGHFPRDSRHFVSGYYQPVPSGQNQSPLKCLPFLELLGWILLSLRDEEPSQTVLIFVPFAPASK